MASWGWNGTRSAAAAAAAESPASAAVRLGRRGQARRSIPTRTSDNGSETVSRKATHPPVWCRSAGSAPGTAQSRRQPTPLAPIQSAAGARGSSAQAEVRPGTLVWNAATAAATAVSTAPRAA